MSTENQIRRIASVLAPIFALTAFFLIVTRGSDWLAAILIFASFIVIGLLLIAFPFVMVDWIYVPKRLKGTDYEHQLAGIVRILGVLFVIFGSAIVMIQLVSHTGKSR